MKIESVQTLLDISEPIYVLLLTCQVNGIFLSKGSGL